MERPGSLEVAAGLRARRRTLGAWLGAFALLTVLRLSTIAPDPWDWDEVLLTDAVQHGIDLRDHRPHPPGYPLLVESADLLHRAGVGPYRSLAIVGTVGGLLAVAALAVFLAAAGLPPGFACLGALLYAFIPSVWLFGVRGFSDAPAVAACLAAAAAFLAGWRRRQGRLVALGVVLSALAAGFRPQCAVALIPLGAVSAFVCLRADRRSWRWLLGGLATGMALSVAIWAPAVVGSGGLRSFLTHLSIQAAGIRRHDLLSPGEVLSPAVLRRWFVDPFGNDPLFWGFAGLAVLGATRRRLAIATLSLMLPWLLLNVPTSSLFSAPRYATFPLAGVAGLAAGGLAVLHRLFAGRSFAAGAILAGAAASAAFPAVLEVARRPSPSAAAIEAIRSAPDRSGTIVHDPALRMHVARLLPSRSRSEIVDSAAVVAAAGDTVLAADRVVDGLLEERRFGYRHAALLSRVSPGLLLNVQTGIATAGLSVGTRAAGPGTEAVRYDNDVPVSVDRPSDGEVVRGLLDVTGWCQLLGGGAVEPEEFRVDGTLVPSLDYVRYPRPDVAKAIPGIGDPRAAGYFLRLDVSGLSLGPHVLRVTFRATDGRRRISPPVRFVRSS